MRFNKRCLWVILIARAASAPAQTTIDLRTQGRNVDFSSAASTRPTRTGTALPQTCAVGEEFFKTDAVPGQNKYACTAPDTWTPIGGGGGTLPGQLGNDFATTATPAVLTTQPGVRTFGSLSLTSPQCVYTITSGTLNGMAYEYFTDSGQVVLEYPTGPGTLVLAPAALNCQAAAVTTPGWPTGLNFHPIATVAIVNGQWGAVTQYPSLSAGWYVVCGPNLECAYSNGTVAVDTGANVMTLGGANQVTGSLDLALAQSFTLPTAAADPAVCAPGQQYFNSGSGKVRVCTAAGAWSDLASGTGGSQVPSHAALDAPVFSGAATGTLDLATAERFVTPGAAADPASCVPGQQYFNSANARVRMCVAANTWTDIALNSEPEGGGVSGNNLTAGNIVVGAGGSAITDSGRRLPAGALVGDTDAQVLAGKTFQSPAFGGAATGTLNLGGAVAFVLPGAASDPAACITGQQYFNTVTANVRACTAVNTWTDLAGGGSGSSSGGETCGKYTTAYSALTANALTQDVPLVLLPANSQLTSLRIKHSTQFACAGCSPAMTALTVSLGDGSTPDVYAPAFSLLTQPPGDSVFWDDGGAFASTAAPHSLTARFTAAGKNLGDGSASSLTAGNVAIWACWRVLP